jgi:hypothetical protein
MANMVGHCGRDADARGFRQLLQPGRDIDGVAVAVLAFDDDIAHMHAHAHIDAPAVGEAVVALRHLALQQHGAFHGIDDAAEFGQQPVAGQLEDAAVMRGDLRLEQLLAVGAEPLERGRLVHLHEPAVADHVNGEDRCELAFHGCSPAMRYADLRRHAGTEILPAHRHGVYSSPNSARSTRSFSGDWKCRPAIPTARAPSTFFCESSINTDSAAGNPLRDSKSS